MDMLLQKEVEMLDNVALKKVDGKTEHVPVSSLTEEEIGEKVCHKCWQHCECAKANECDKIYDQYKKTIDEYEFITDGIQIYDNEGRLEKFIVTNCKNYKAKEKLKVSSSERELLNRVIRLYGYKFKLDNIDALNELYELDYRLSQNGHLTENEKARVYTLEKEGMHRRR